MTPSEWQFLASAVNGDIAAMTRAARTQREIRQALQQRQASPTEEYFIDEDAFGGMPTSPRVFQFAGARVKVWKVHRAGLSCADIKGGDLYYELSDEKFVLVQYKTPNRRNRVSRDDEQLRELQGACPTACPPSNRFTCGAWYALRSTSSAEYFPACEARTTFGEHDSRHTRYFINGLSRDRFQEDFGLCRIGARTRPLDVTNYRTWSIEHDRVFVSAVKE